VIAPATLTTKAREWLGVRFVHQGRTRFGCDCLGFIAGVLGELGEPLALKLLPSNYGREPQGLLLETLTKNCKQIPLQPGALLLIEWPLSNFPSHAALFTGASMIHSYEAAAHVVEHGYRAPWLTRTVSTWALPGVTYE
jgi:cell wall-associated NlpC family hydrolase